jgi:hypothetical protein
MKNPNKNNDNRELKGRNPRLLGLIYILLGITGLCFSLFALVYSLETAPLYSTLTIFSMVSLLSILLILYGYQVIKKDY